MADMVDINARLSYWKTQLDKLYAAYTALVEGGVSSYTIDDRTLTKFNIRTLRQEIEAAEKKVSELTAISNGGRARKAYSIIPRDW